MKRSACISQDGIYRYTLTRDWSEGAAFKTVVFVGLNPSTADGEVDDPTIRRCIGFAKSWGFNRLIMVNLWAYRSPEPADLKKAAAPLGIKNLGALIKYSAEADLTVAAWGVHGAWHNMGRQMLPFLTNPHHLGLTKGGFPKHPLYLKADVRPQPMEIPNVDLNG